MELTALQINFAPQEIPFYLELGVLAGILGALFNQGIIAFLTLNCGLRLPVPVRVGGAGLVCGIAFALLPHEFRDSAGLREMLTTGEATWQVTAIAFVAQFLLTLVAYGSGAPGGFFAPVLILGASLGYLVGLSQAHLLGVSPPITYALAGMGTFFGAVVRVPITGIVIVFEMTTDFNLVLPLMIGSAVAYLVAEKLAPGSLYDRLLEWRGIHLETASEGLLTALTAADVMQRRVETLTPQMRLAEAVQAFSRSQHHNFPVVQEGKVVGIISQKDLTDASSVEETLIQAIMTPEPFTVRPTQKLAEVLHLLTRYNFNCLPVTEGQHLVGIITHRDIIRAEANQLNGLVGQGGQPSYSVYQTRSPATGQGRLLVPLSNPDTTAMLVKMALAIARAHHYELEYLQVIVVPSNCIPAQTPVQTTRSRRLLRQAVQLAKGSQIPVHTQIRVAHDVSQAIIETVKERHIDLLLIGWKVSTATSERIFSRVVDTVIRQAPCQVLVAKLSEQPRFERWLVPIAGGPNAKEAVRLLPALTSLANTPKVNICQVFTSTAPDTNELEHAVRWLKERLKAQVVATPVSAANVPEAIISLAGQDHSDVIILGASREGLLQQAIKGNIPETKLLCI